MAKRKNSLQAWKIHPGEILREEFLRPMGLTPYELAKRIQVPAPRVNDIVLERRGITADTALRFAKFFGTSEQFWMNLQTAYEIRLARRKLARTLRRIPSRRARQAA
jgi:addiction module HigA family antidote